MNESKHRRPRGSAAHRLVHLFGLLSIGALLGSCSTKPAFHYKAFGEFPSPNFLRVQVKRIEQLVQEEESMLDSSNAYFEPRISDRQLTVRIRGQSEWRLDLKAGKQAKVLKTGVTYTPPRVKRKGLDQGWFEASSHNVSCLDGDTWLALDRIRAENGELTQVDLRFHQVCDGGKRTVDGQLHWTKADRGAPRGAVFPPPDNLWRPKPGAVPSVGNFAYYEHVPVDPSVPRLEVQYTHLNAGLEIDDRGRSVDLRVNGDTQMNVTFGAMEHIGVLRPGYYDRLNVRALPDATKASLSVQAGLLQCDVEKGWFVVDGLGEWQGRIVDFEARFEVTCGNKRGVVRGQIRWRQMDVVAPPGPVQPVPKGLWRAPAGAVAKQGSYVYLEFGEGYGHRSGRKILYSSADATLSKRPGAEGFSLLVEYEDHGFFEGLFLANGKNASHQLLEVAYYPDIRSTRPSNPAKGFMRWSFGENCRRVSWFAVDNVKYRDGELIAIDLRFEQRCEDKPDTLRGQIHWFEEPPRAKPLKR